MSIENPLIRKVFDDLDKFRDFCRFEAKVFNEADMYNHEAPVWIAYNKHQGWLRAKARAGANYDPNRRKRSTNQRFNNNNNQG
jgi:hypothetical protein|tara:strand:- start:303 stop:551 length:249 start_codon:yes stop_codon:yes gene_type:complete